MSFDKKFKKNLQEITDRLGNISGMEHDIHLEWGEVAEEREIASLEALLGIMLPPSFRQMAGNLGRSLYFSYSLSDFNMPEEFD